jgi:hypothetical protein
MNEERHMQKGESLARLCAQNGVQESHLGWVLAHLKHFQDPHATRTLLECLPRSAFAQRTKKTREQIEHLSHLVLAEVQSQRPWQEAATIVGWAKRLLAVYKPR